MSYSCSRLLILFAYLLVLLFSGFLFNFYSFLFYFIFIFMHFIYLYLIFNDHVCVIRYKLVKLASASPSLIRCGNCSWSLSSWGTHWSRSTLWVWFVAFLPSSDPAHSFYGGINWIRWWWWWWALQQPRDFHYSETKVGHNITQHESICFLLKYAEHMLLHVLDNNSKEYNTRPIRTSSINWEGPLANAFQEYYEQS